MKILPTKAVKIHRQIDRLMHERDRLKAINDDLVTALEACSTWFAEAPIAELEAVEQAIEKKAPVALIHAAIAKAEPSSQ